MKNFNNVTLAILLLALPLTKTFSQGSFHVGTSIPLLDFASDDLNNEDAAGATVGFNAGFQYLYPFSESDFGLFGRIDFMYNGLSDEIKDYLKDAYDNAGVDADITLQKYINVPITAGLNYSFQADEKVAIFANAGLVVNFLKITDAEVKVGNEKLTDEFDVTKNVGFKVGAGILFNDKISIAVDYFGLGTHDIDGKETYDDESVDIDGELKVDLLTVSLGINF